MTRVPPSIVGSEGQERDVTRALHRQRDAALMLGAGTRNPARHDLAAVGDEVAQALRVFVVDGEGFVGAEGAAAAAHSAESTAPAVLVPAVVPTSVRAIA